MVVGEGKRRRITVVLGCGRGREGGFGDERLCGNSGEVGGRLSCDLSFGLGYMGVGGSLTVRSSP